MLSRVEGLGGTVAWSGEGRLAAILVLLVLSKYSERYGCAEDKRK